jgi:transposase
MPPVNRNQPKRAKSSDSEYTLMEFMRDFPDDATCLDWLWRNRYAPDGEHAHCPKCEAKRAFVRYTTSQQRQSWTCTACGYHLHPTAGTIFHKSSTSLHLWFYAMYLMTSTRCGISAKQLEREIGVTYKTAWRMAHLIREKLMSQDAGPFTNGEPIEIDETYYGPRQPSRMKRVGPESKKSVVFGMVQRKGRVAAMTVANAKKATLFPIIEERILPRSTVFTDELHTYDKLGGKGYIHDRVRHSERIYVSGDVHTNTIEGFWSLVKRGLDGVFHGVSKKHLQGYLNEYAWRYNQRHDERGRFQALLLRSTL